MVAIAPRRLTAEPFPAVTTERLILRCAREDDAAALAALMTDGISVRLASWPPAMTQRMALDRILGARQAAWDGRSVPLVMERRQDGALIGWFAASCTPDDTAVALLTYWLGDAFHGAGLMREAAPAALGLVLRVLHPRRLRAAVQADNAASLAVVRLLGMQSIGPGRIWCAARGREEPCIWFDRTLGTMER